MMITHDDNLILQTYYATSLIAELKNNKFIESDYFENMKFGQPAIKEELKKLGADNQGAALMALYAMLVVPKEILKDKYIEEYVKINEFLDGVVTNTNTNYRYDSPKTDYIRHIRNSVAHARVEFHYNEYVLFQDRDDRQTCQFETRLPMSRLGEFIGMLQSIHVRYVGDRRNEIQRQG